MLKNLSCIILSSIAFISSPALTEAAWSTGQQIAPVKADVSSFSVVPLPARYTYIPKFYKKLVLGADVPIVSSQNVPNAALIEAARIIREMLMYRPDIAKTITNLKIRVVVMSKDQQTTDIPEHSDLTPKSYWDERARGLGATHGRPATSVGEENLLMYKVNRYPNQSILIHEFAHTVHEIALEKLDKTFDRRLIAIYERARSKGLWNNTYNGSNHKEYWAGGVTAYFNAATSASPANGIYNHVATRDQLREYDPDLASLIEEVFKQ